MEELMRNPNHNETNARKLAEECVEFWDMDCLIEFAVEELTARYLANKERFLADWKDLKRT
ncbi:hypothetical protein EBT11_09345 [bacterium]|nr:hypothetical protein [bacterium]